MSAGFIYARAHAHMRQAKTNPANPANPAAWPLTCADKPLKIVSKPRDDETQTPQTPQDEVAGFAGFGFSRSNQTPHTPQAPDLHVAGFAGFAEFESSRAHVRARVRASRCSVRHGSVRNGVARAPTKAVR